MTALLPGSSSAGALPPGKAGGAMVTGGASMLAKRGAAGGYAAGVRDGVKKGMGKEPIWSSGTTSGGEYLSVADRKAIFRKQKINAAKFVGRSASAAGGAIVSGGSSALGSAINPRAGGLQAPDSGADAEPQNSKIGSRVKALEDLVAEISESVKSNSKKITLLKNVVKSHIQRFADFLKNDSEQKRKELLQQQQAEAKAIEEGQRDAAEEGLEAPNKMKKTLLQPVQMVGKKVGGILQKLKDAFLVLFAGWMTNRGFEAIKAFMDGDKEKLKEIRNNVLGALGVVGGVFLLLSGGLLALPGIIASVVGVIATVGGAILGFLLSPPGLITLAIAAGVGGLLLGVKKLWNWGEDKVTGGGALKDKHKELDQRLIDAGMDTRGRVKSGKGGKKATKDPEQLKILEEVEAERAKLHELKNKMNAEIENVPNEVPMSGTKITGKGRNKKTVKFHTKEDKELIKQRQDEIRAKYDSLVSGKPQKQVSTVSSTSTSQSVSASATDSNVSKVTPTTTPGPMADPKPNVVMKKAAAPASPGAPQGSSGSPTTSVPSIPSADPDNFYVMYSKMHYNVVT
jgi:hypothetical protein